MGRLPVNEGKEDPELVRARLAIEAADITIRIKRVYSHPSLDKCGYALLGEIPSGKEIGPLISVQAVLSENNTSGSIVGEVDLGGVPSFFAITRNRTVRTPTIYHHPHGDGEVRLPTMTQEMRDELHEAWFRGDADSDSEEEDVHSGRQREKEAPSESEEEKGCPNPNTSGSSAIKPKE